MFTHLVTGDLLILSGSSVTLKKKIKMYLLEINRPIASSHNPSPSTPPTPISCQSAAQLMDQSTKHDTEHDLQITDGSPTCTHCTETLDGCETTKTSPTKRVRRMNKCRGGEFMAADQVSTYSLCYTTHANADFNAGRSTN